MSSEISEILSLDEQDATFLAELAQGNDKTEEEIIRGALSFIHQLKARGVKGTVFGSPPFCEDEFIFRLPFDPTKRIKNAESQPADIA